MARCPSCLEEMRVFRFGKLELDSCAVCGGFWFDRGELERLVPPAAVRQALTRAKPAVSCRACGGPVGEQGCERCDRPVASCPRCEVPLSQAKVHELQLDGCPRCSGVFLDAGELQLLGNDAAQLDALQVAVDAASSKNTEGLRCSQCGKELTESVAFSLGEDRYCGSGAPTGASPVVAALAPRRVEDPCPRRDRFGRPIHNVGGEEIESGVLTFFNWLFS